MQFGYTDFRKSADSILEKIDYTPEIAVILGSGLGPLAREIENPVEIDYGDIPNFLISTVEDHAGKLILGTLEGRKVVCMSGRFHYYEGYDFEQLVVPIRVFKLLGVRATILTNAAGAINTSVSPGEAMMITDHIKLMGASPLRGPNIPEFGPRFFSVNDMYSRELIDIAREASGHTELTVHEGVYFYCGGPQYETPAEIRAMRILGADAVGMSTATEAVTAAHCGMPLLAVSLLTNMAAGVVDNPPSSEEVLETAALASKKLTGYLKEILARMEKGGY